jgi:hypothetical protein
LDLLRNELYIYIFIFLIFIATIIYIIKTGGDRKKSIIPLSLAAFITIAAIAVLHWNVCISGGWYGYELNGAHLHLKAPPVDEVIDLRICNIFLTNSSEWKPKLRTFGYKAGELRMGHHKLKNDIDAVVFMHKTDLPLLVINCSGKYYVISHPGVEKLYESIQSI